MPATPMTLAIVGATGVTGRHVLGEAVRQGLTPLVVGRDSPGLRRLVEGAGIDAGRVRIADIHDPRSLRAALTNVSHVISTIAPFSANGFGIARAAAELGLGYTDSTGETGFVIRVGEELDALAQASRATLCTGNGVGAFLGDVATHWIAPLDDAAGEATILYDIRGYRPSAGSIESYLSHILPEGGAAVRDGKALRFPLGAFSGAVGDLQGIHGIFPDAIVIARYWRARRIDVLMKASPTARPFVHAAAAVAANRYVRRALLAAPWRKWLAADENDDLASQCSVHVEVVDGAGRRKRRSVRIERIYLTTAQVMLATMTAMARRGERPTGVRAASEMFDDFAEVLALTGVKEVATSGR